VASMKLAERPGPAPAATHAARIHAAGSHGHLHAQDLRSLAQGILPRDFDDLVHFLCNLYGRQPALLDLALTLCRVGPVHDWLDTAANAFERERLYLVRLTAAVGPPPSTPGSGDTEAALVAQRHALETLARSERHGCALGAATALISDWRAIRPLLDRAALRVGVEPPAPSLPSEESIGDILDQGIACSGDDRAVRFGAEQLLLQHRTMFDLLEARADARDLS
jgi:hypothetical protein